ncbi:MAG: dihydroorotate dehydrogenase electron transfer subunit [Erysipelotrichaceae bacterium]
MKQGIFTIVSNKALNKTVYEMILQGDTSGITNCGQFINIKIDGVYLRRPISVCEYDTNEVKIIYKTIGEGTKLMSKMVKGQTLDILSGLGNGYDISKSGNRPLLIGGGVGVPPLYQLAKDLINNNIKPIIILGFSFQDDCFYIEEFKNLGLEVYVSTNDGSIGTKGFVTNVMEGINDYTYFYTRGPEVMLKAISNMATTSGQLSFEERMGCGFGACMGCSCKTKYGNKRICKEGPVLQKEEIIW